MTSACALLTTPRADATEMVQTLNVSGSVFGAIVGESELASFLTHLAIKERKGANIDTLLKVLDVCPYSVFGSVHSFLKALITLPLTTCSVERLFSSVQRVKTALRSTMTSNRLNGLCLLAFERDLTEGLNYDAVIDIFKHSKPRRLMF